MSINDISNKLDGWTRLRVDLYNEETCDYHTIFDSDDYCGWAPCDLDNFINPNLDLENVEVDELAIDDNHIVVRCSEY